MSSQCDDIVQLQEPPEDRLQRLLWLEYQKIRFMYRAGAIEQAQATSMRLKAYRDYEEDLEWWTKQRQLYQKQIEDIKRTTELRIKLNKECTLDTALELIGAYSGEEWKYNKMRREENDMGYNK